MRGAWLTSSILLLGCGAKTGLTVPVSETRFDGGRDAPMDAPRMDARPDVPLDAPLDGGVDGGPDVPFDGCTAIILALTPIRAEVLFVLDRSTSMGWALSGPSGSGPSRYAILDDALRATLPSYDATLDMGAVLYPNDAGDGCSADVSPPLPPRPANATAVLSLVSGNSPGGRTPSAEGLRTAQRYFSARPDRSRARAVVLATDGAPNCNPMLDGFSCPCTGGAGLPVGTCGGDSLLCLDDTRTIGVIQTLADDGVPTYVIGIDGDPDPALSRVLTRMAEAGGRPNPRDPGRAYYAVDRSADLAAAFDRIQASIVSCSLSFTGTLDSRRDVVVRMDGSALVRDPGHVDGWDLSPDLDGTVILYGETCARAQEGVHTLDIVQPCG